MVMDGRAFLQVAKEVLRGRTEAHWRSAAGRAYYALMLECRVALQRWGFQVPHGPGVHNFVRLRFSRTGDADLQAISDDLDWMCRVRNYADYELPTSPSFNNIAKAGETVARATNALTLLDAIEADLTRRDAAVAAIQAAWP